MPTDPIRSAAEAVFNELCDPFDLEREKPESFAFWKSNSVQNIEAVLRRELGEPADAGAQRPRIVCLCGSTRFRQQFQEANAAETMAGRIVLSVGFYVHGDGVTIAPEEKAALDELHKRKIDLADEVLILNVGGYVGDSTRSEIEYAKAHGKPLRWLEPPLPAPLRKYQPMPLPAPGQHGTQKQEKS